MLNGNISNKLSIKNKGLNFSNFYAYLILIIPAFIFYFVFFVVPVGSSIIFSFTKFNGANLNLSFIGLKNYRILLADKAFYDTLINTIIFAVFVCIIQNGLAIIVAIGLTSKIYTKDYLRTMFFIPCMLSAVVVGFLWSYIYSGDGALNTIFRMIGLDKLARPWLGTTQTALYAIIFTNIWRYVGQCSVLYIANIKTIPGSLYEACEIDGASGFRKFIHVTFPLIAPATTVNVITSFIGSLQSADIIIAMTQGGPGHASETLGSYILEMMGNSVYGYASAVSVVLMILIVVVNVFLFKKLTNREVEM